MSVQLRGKGTSDPSLDVANVDLDATRDKGERVLRP